MGKNNIRIGSISPGLTKSEALENNTGPTVAEMVYANTPHLQSKGPSMSIRYRPRFFEQVGHQTLYSSSGNKHFFTKSCHHQTYQNYEQPP